MGRRDGNSFLAPPPIPPAGLVASFPGEPGALTPLAAPSTSALPAPTTLKPQGKLWKNCGNWPQGWRPPGGPALVPTFPTLLERPTAPPPPPKLPNPLSSRDIWVGSSFPTPLHPNPTRNECTAGMRETCPPSQGATESPDVRPGSKQVMRQAGTGDLGPFTAVCVPGQVSPHLFKQQIQRNCKELKLAAHLHSWGKS